MDDGLTVNVSTLKLQIFPTREASLIHDTRVSVLSTILHEVYEQGLVAESVKYWVMSTLVGKELSFPDFKS